MIIFNLKDKEELKLVKFALAHIGHSEDPIYNRLEETIVAIEDSNGRE